MKRTKKLTAVIAAAVSMGLSGPLFADAEDQPHSAFSTPSSEPSSVFFYGDPLEQTGDPNVSLETGDATSSASGYDMSLAGDEGMSAFEAETTDVAVPSLVFSDGEWYSFADGTWYAMSEGEWYALDDSQYYEDTAAYSMSDEVIGTIELYSMDGTEWYSVEDGEWQVWVPVAMISESPSETVYLR